MQSLNLHRLGHHFWPYMRKHALLLVGASTTLFAEIVWRVLEPWPLKFVVDYVIGGKPLTSMPFGAMLATLNQTTMLTAAVIGMVLITVLRATAGYVSTVSFALAGNRVLNSIRFKLYQHLQSLSLSFHTKARNGDLIVRISSDINQLTDVVVTAALPLAANALVMLGMLGMMVWMNPRLALLACAALPLFWLITRRYGNRIQEAARKQRKREGALAAAAGESFGAIKIVQALGLEGAFSQAFEKQNDRSLTEGARAARLSSSLERSVDVLLVCANAAVVWLGARMVLANELSIGDLLVFLSYLKSTLKPIQDFAKYTGRLAKASAAGERVIGLLDQEPDVRNKPNAMPAPAFRGQVRFENVCFGYDAEHPVLKNISFTVQPGQRVAIVGQSGNGKTTLTNLLMRLYDPTAGRVLIDGCDVRDYTLESLRAQISVVMQDTILFATSVRENIALGVPHAKDADVERVARLANAHEFIMEMPQGYDTVLGERGVTLSNGQRQRISIARTAIRKSPLLILDEPTTGLDKTNEHLVMEALERISGNCTTFYITHNLAHIKPDDLVLFLEAGTVREFGSHQELLRLNGAYAIMHRLNVNAHVTPSNSVVQVNELPKPKPLQPVS